MELALLRELVPAHIDGFGIQTDGRFSRFSALGTSPVEPRARHSRAELELNLVLRGRAHALVGERHVTLEPNSMLWIRPRQNQLLLDASENLLSWVLVFRPRLVRRATTTPLSAPLRASGGDEVLLRRIAKPEALALSQLFSSLPVGQGRDVFNAGLGYALTRAWLAFTRAPEIESRAQVHPAVRRAAWLLRDGHTELSNVELASRVGLSPHRLSRLFKREMGTTLVELRNRQRLERFVSALGDGETHNLLGLALEVGFGSYTQFHRVFRREMGCSPAEYVKRRRL